MVRPSVPAPATLVVSDNAEMINSSVLATKRKGTGIGQDLALIDVDLQLVQMIDPVTGVVVFEDALDRRVIDVHHRDFAVARLGRGNAFADFLEDSRAAFDAILDAHSVPELGAHPLIGLMNLFFELLDESLIDGCGHFRPSVELQRETTRG